MIIDIRNTVEGNRYPIKDVIPANNDLFGDRGIRLDPIIGVEGYYEVDNTIVHVNVSISFTYYAKCDKCLADIVKSDVLVFDDYYFSDGSIYELFYEDYKVELDGAILEKIVFSIPRQLLCKKDCKGLCPKCGIDKNYSECDCDNSHDESNPFSILKSIVGGA